MKVSIAALLALVTCSQAHVTAPQVSAYYRALSPIVLARPYAPPAPPAPALYSYYSAPTSTSHAFTVSHYQPASWAPRLYPQVFSSIPFPYLNSLQSYQPFSFVHQIPQTVATTLIDQQQFLPSPSNDISNDGPGDDTISVGSAAQGPDFGQSPQEEQNSDQPAVEIGQEEQVQTFPSQQFPAQQFPAQQFPAQQFPAQQFPAQQFPAQQFPAQQFPAQQFPAQQFPAQQFPAQQFPAQQFPAQQFPAQQFPTQEIPQQTTSPSQQPEQSNTEAILGASNPSVPDDSNDDTVTVDSA